ncbi:TolC family protein [Adhaeretor mobilis]|uniref:TolC family protein n=1 Tax=Adhaeretor mobilis TaxID=1930276 RepID=UPI001C54E529|nr:TolC family protein [Adhaeretor mobilis]
MLPSLPQVELCSYVSEGHSRASANESSPFKGPALANGDTLSIDEALRFALEYSDIARSLDGDEVVLEQATGYDAPISSETVRQALAAFDTSLDTSFSWNRFEGPPNSFFGPGIDREDRRDEATFATGLSKLWQRGTQTRVGYNPSPGYLFFPGGSTGFNPTHVSAFEVEVRQPLLQGGGLEVNRAPILVAQLQTDQSAWEFKEALLEMVQSVEKAYWELYAARVARRVLEEQSPMIEEVVRVEEANMAADRSVKADVAKARTQLYRLRQRKVGADRVIREKEIQLGSLIGLSAHRRVSLELTTQPPTAPMLFDKYASIERAINNQPLLVQRRIRTRIRELEIRVASNQYLPKLDLQALYRANGLEDDLGNALEMMVEQDFYDWQFGAAFSVPLGRNGPRARLREAELQLAREQAQLREQVRLTVFEITEIHTRIEALYAEYRVAKERENQAKQWLEGAQIRYKNPPPAGRTVNWMVIALNDLLLALQGSSDAAEEAAVLLAEYNTELARLQQVEGNLLGKYNVCLLDEPLTNQVKEQLPAIAIPKQQPAEELPKNEKVDNGGSGRNAFMAVSPEVALDARLGPWWLPAQVEPILEPAPAELELLPQLKPPQANARIKGVSPVKNGEQVGWTVLPPLVSASPVVPTPKVPKAGVVDNPYVTSSISTAVLPSQGGEASSPEPPRH